jgi:SAM-dependent methyltransferase
VLRRRQSNGTRGNRLLACAALFARQGVLSYLGMTTEASPLRLGAPEQFQTVRELLTRAEFTEPAICGRLGIPAFTKFGDIGPERRIAPGMETPFDILVRLFLDCVAVPRSVVVERLGSAEVAIMAELGLLVTDAESVVSPIGLAPTRGLWLVSDKGGELGTLAGDVVYPAIMENTQEFLSIVPDSPCEAFLDLGAGTGVAALMAARAFARHAWACDITPRASHFAEFNRRLNGLENATVAQGDLYEPIEGRQFDRIVTHPPYVPVANPTCVFRDGGDDGEQIVRRIVQGLPRHLAPGGRFYALTLVSDRDGAPAESRVRDWLGDTHEQFDVAVVADTAREPFDFIGRAMQKGTHYPQELQYWSTLFRKLRVKYLVYGCIVVQRHGATREPFTLRLQKGRRSGRAETEWAMQWNTEASSVSVERLLSSRLRVSPDLNLAVLHKVHQGSLVPEEFLLRVNYPFDAECKCPRWCAGLVSACDGSRTASETLQALKSDGVVDPHTEPAEFADVIRVLLGSGFLESDALPAVPREQY